MSSSSNGHEDDQPKCYNATLRSRESIERAFIHLHNTTARPIDVYWINYTSQLIRYKTLEPNAGISLDTYSTHPWIFRDRQTGLKMHVNHQEVFWPEPWTLTKSMTRTKVYIHYPLLNLNKIAAWNIVVHISCDGQLDRLEIPKILLRDLRAIFKEYIDYKLSRSNGPP